MSSHDLNLLALGAGIGAQLLLLVWVLLGCLDDKRRTHD